MPQSWKRLTLQWDADLVDAVVQHCAKRSIPVTRYIRDLVERDMADSLSLPTPGRARPGPGPREKKSAK